MVDSFIGISRGLVVRAPWSFDIVDGIKPWEMRSRRTNFRGRFGIINGGSGLVIGVATLVDCLDPLPEENYFDFYDKHRIDHNCVNAIKWKYPWVLEDCERFQEPIKYIHKPGAVVWINLKF